MDAKTRGWILIIGALVAGWLAWNEQDYAALIFALLFLISGWHHTFGTHGAAAAKKKKR